MENILDLKNKIISIIRRRGPALPIQISTELKMNSIIISAFLSELLSENEIKISKMRVGGSPLYFLSGQEPLIEKFYIYLPGKEKEAVLLLKQNKILRDDEQEPAIRVALRNIRDFSFPLILKLDNQQLIFWRYFSFPEEEAKQEIEKIITGKIKKIKIEKPKESKKEHIEPSEKRKEKKILEEKTIQKPVLELKPPKPKKIPEKSDFVKKVIFFVEQQDIEILEEKEAKKKEFLAVIKINTDLGKTNYLCIAKDKKKITENDLAVSFQKAQRVKLPALLIINGELNNKAKTYLQEYKNLMKVAKLN